MKSSSLSNSVQPQFRLFDFVQTVFFSPVPLLCPTITYKEIEVLAFEELGLKSSQFFPCYGDEEEPNLNQIKTGQIVDSFRFVNEGISLIPYYTISNKKIRFCYKFKTNTKTQSIEIDSNAPFGEVLHHLRRTHNSSKNKIKFRVSGYFSSFQLLETMFFETSMIVSEAIKQYQVEYFFVTKLIPKSKSNKTPEPAFKLIPESQYDEFKDFLKDSNSKDSKESKESESSFSSSPSNHLEIVYARCKECKEYVSGPNLRHHFFNEIKNGRRYATCRFPQNKKD